MRILVNDFAGHPFQVELSRALAARGHNVLHCYCASNLSPKGSLTRRDDDAGNFAVRPISIGESFEKYGMLKRWSQERAIGREIAVAANKFAPDVIISANTPLGTQGVLMGFARSQNIPFVFWLQDLLSIGICGQLQKRLPVVGGVIGRVFRVYEHVLLARSFHVVSITKDFLKYLPRRMRKAERASVIQNWAPLNELPLQPRDNGWSRRHGLAGKTCVLYAGTLGLKHNPELLVKLALQYTGNPTVQVVVVSEGQGADYLARRKAELALGNLTLLPFQRFEDMPEVLASADILVSILEKEAGVFAVPSKVLTYLCAARPLLLAMPETNLAARIVREVGAGLSAAPDDAGAFIAAAGHLIENPGLREDMALRARDYAERHFDIHSIVRRFETVLMDATIVPVDTPVYGDAVFNPAMAARA
jgi:glycosyltransferase involved in cell wall biosynthesis